MEVDLFRGKKKLTLSGEKEKINLFKKRWTIDFSQGRKLLSFILFGTRSNRISVNVPTIRIIYSKSSVSIVDHGQITSPESMTGLRRNKIFKLLVPNARKRKSKKKNRGLVGWTKFHEVMKSFLLLNVQRLLAYVLCTFELSHVNFLERKTIFLARLRGLLACEPIDRFS